jgi:hypothetical protein
MVVRQLNPVLDADKAMQTKFAAIGFTTVLVDDDVATAADATGKVLVYLSSTAIETKVLNKFHGSPHPVMVALQQLYDEMQMTTDQGQTNLTAGTSMLPLHPINSPINGATTLLNSSKPITWGTPAASADVLLTVNNGTTNKASEFVYEPNDVLVDGSAAAGCRVGFPAERTNVSAWTAAMTTRFQKTVWWSVYGCGNGIIGTVAGNGTTTIGADGSLSTLGGMNDPMGILVDPNGGFYYTDYGNHRVRHVDASGIVTTVAGTGTSGSTGDGGPATSARLNTPARIRLDPQGRLVIVDLGNAKIRRISATGIITTIAGTGTKGFNGDNGQATNARLNAPQDVAWNAAGEMFIADRANHRIRKVALSGVITTVVGTSSSGYNGDEILATTARLQNPYGVTFLADGTMLIADQDNSRIRSVDSLGYIHTVAGTGLLTANGDGGPAILADLHKPFCVVAAPAGGFYICDYNNNRIRYVDADGVISTVVGAGTAGFSGDGDLAVYAKVNRISDIGITASGDMYIMDRLNRRVRIVNKEG